MPPPGVPGPFSLGDAGRLEALLRDAGMTHVAVTAHPVPIRARSFEEWWTRTSALAGPLASILAGLPDHVGGAIVERLRPATAGTERGRASSSPGSA